MMVSQSLGGTGDDARPAYASPFLVLVGSVRATTRGANDGIAEAKGGFNRP
jgi:hypothetical protein